MFVSPRRKGPEVHFDYVFIVFGGPGLQICVFRLGEKAPRSTLTVYLQCLVALGYKYVYVSPRRKGPEVNFDCVFTVFVGPGLQICVFCLGEKKRGQL